MKNYRFPILLAAALALQGCTVPHTSGTLYKTHEVGRVQDAHECTVLSTEAVVVQSDTAKHVGTGTGAIVGGITGAILGEKVGKGSGRRLAKIVGGTAGALSGAAAGTHAGAALGKRQGVRYAVELAGEETRIVVQELPEGESALAPGSPCWLTTGAQSRVTAR